MNEKLTDLYKKRHGSYVKDPQAEDFFSGMNRVLQQHERDMYTDRPIRYPFVFVFGLPRSGTTLITQLISGTLDTGFINNLMARFWLAPLHGIRLSRALLGDQRAASFQSDYARTRELADIHEFGYFWRYWLKKESFRGVTRARELENEIDWPGLRRVLAAMQNEFDRPMIFKNIFGSYHLARLNQLLEKVIFIYIKRDILDSAVSILDARRKYYDDLNTWWSYMPVEYELIKDRDYWQQIAGQVFFLSRYYDNQISQNKLNNVLTIHYRDMCANPALVPDALNEMSESLFGYRFKQVSPPPASFPFRTYSDRDEEKDLFRELIEQFAAQYR